MDFPRVIVLNFGPQAWGCGSCSSLDSHLGCVVNVPEVACASLIVVMVTVAVESLDLDAAWMSCPKVVAMGSNPACFAVARPCVS